MVLSFGLLMIGCGSSTTPGTTAEASLSFDSELCRNNGRVSDGRTVWGLADSVPFSWRNQSPKLGELEVIDSLNATFTVGEIELRLTTGGIDTACHGWEEGDS